MASNSLLRFHGWLIPIEAVISVIFFFFLSYEDALLYIGMAFGLIFIIHGGLFFSKRIIAKKFAPTPVFNFLARAALVLLAFFGMAIILYGIFVAVGILAGPVIDWQRELWRQRQHDECLKSLPASQYQDAKLTPYLDPCLRLDSIP